ncbi:uncharacterized protein LOC134762535 isoform X1 [Penaeus indicus]|uniref:uncharacterized protein LOC134762535 isoform X1 n=2 Tax=Penaeus indicus TaxID=29960 RepID=UPI00300C8A20
MENGCSQPPSCLGSGAQATSSARCKHERRRDTKEKYIPAVTTHPLVTPENPLQKLADSLHSMDSTALKCSCLEIYNESNRRPRFMPCGHIRCTSCCEEGVVAGRLQCHKCDLFHYPIHSLHVFPIAYIVEDLVKHYQKISDSSEASCQGNDDSDEDEPRFVLTQDPRWVSSSTMTSMLIKQDSSMADFASTFLSSKAKLDKYGSALDYSLKEHEKMKEDLNAYVKLNEKLMHFLKMERCAMDEHRKEGEELMKNMNSAKQLIQNITSVKDALEKLKKSDECLEKAKDWAEQNKDRFPNDKMITATAQLRLIVKKNLIAMEEEFELEKDEEDEEEKSFCDSPFSICKSLLGPAEINKEIKVNNPYFKYLLHEYVRIVDVYAVQDENKIIRSAKLSVYENRIHLHNLEVGAPPDDAYTIKHSDLIDLLDSSSTLTFLDFKEDGEEAERVYIRMNGDTTRAKQFILLCAGTWGGSYADTDLIMIWNKGCEGECVWGGDYNYGSSIIPGLVTGGEYQHPNKLGTVSGWYTDYRGTRFCITTKDKSHCNLSSAFGMVERGIDVVVKIARLFHGRGWKVASCGLVIEEGCLNRTQRRNTREEEDQSDTSSNSSGSL